MAVPPPIPDPTHIETRLLIVTEMLDKAIAEVHHVMNDIKDRDPSLSSKPDPTLELEAEPELEAASPDPGGDPDAPADAGESPHEDLPGESMTITPPLPPAPDERPVGSKPALDVSLAELVNESRALRGDVHGAEEARRKATLINMALLAVVVIFVGMLLAVTLQNRALTHRLDDTNARISDCTTPGGHCYTEGRERTNTAIQDIIRSEVFMAECARLFPGEAGPVYDRKLEQCVVDRLAGPQLRPSTAPTPAVTASGTR